VGPRAAAIGLILAVIGLGIACRGGGAASDPPADGGFSGRRAALYRYAYAHRLQFGTASARSHPTGSDPPVYSLKDAYPVVMIGTLKPHGAAEWQAAKDGCAFGIVRAFAAAHSSKTAAVCTHMAAFLPPNLPECPNI
jgi:hypothetical protein